MNAGNTVESLRPVDVNEAAAAIVPTPAESEAPVAEETVPVTESEHVSREEHHNLRDAFLRLVDRIEKFNVGAPHKI